VRRWIGLPVLLKSLKVEIEKKLAVFDPIDPVPIYKLVLRTFSGQLYSVDTFLMIYFADNLPVCREDFLCGTTASYSLVILNPGLAV